MVEDETPHVVADVLGPLESCIHGSLFPLLRAPQFRCPGEVLKVLKKPQGKGIPGASGLPDEDQVLRTSQGLPVAILHSAFLQKLPPPPREGHEHLSVIEVVSREKSSQNPGIRPPDEDFFTIGREEARLELELLEREALLFSGQVPVPGPLGLVVLVEASHGIKDHEVPLISLGVAHPEWEGLPRVSQDVPLLFQEFDEGRQPTWCGPDESHLVEVLSFPGLFLDRSGESRLDGSRESCLDRSGESRLAGSRESCLDHSVESRLAGSEEFCLAGFRVSRCGNRSPSGQACQGNQERGDEDRPPGKRNPHCCLQNDSAGACSGDEARRLTGPVSPGGELVGPQEKGGEERFQAQRGRGGSLWTVQGRGIVPRREGIPRPTGGDPSAGRRVRMRGSLEVTRIPPLKPPLKGRDALKTLYLLRHAKSSWEHDGMSDYDRPLAPRGLKAAPRMGQFMAREELIPHRTLCSGALRAIETWELVAPTLGRTVPTEFRPEVYHSSPSSLMELIHGLPETDESALLVGHNPTFQELSLSLAGSGDEGALRSIRAKFPTGALAVLDFPFRHWPEVAPGAGYLRMFVRPRSLKKNG